MSPLRHIVSPVDRDDWGSMNAENLVITFKRDMAKLSGTERRRVIESVRDVIRAAAFDDAAGSAYEVERCCRCGSVATAKKGKTGNDDQRYLCRGCGRTFGMGSGRILGTSRLPKETWMAYAECFVLMLPLRECARRCRVCLKTAYTMRHRLIECLSAYSPSFRVGRGSGCELDETYFPESFKGNHAKGSFTMPRPPHRDGSNGRTAIYEERYSHAVEHTGHDDLDRPGGQEGGHGHPGRARHFHVHRRQRVPQGARPGVWDAVRDEGQDAGARRGGGEIAGNRLEAIEPSRLTQPILSTSPPCRI